MPGYVFSNHTFPILCYSQDSKFEAERKRLEGDSHVKMMGVLVGNLKSDGRGFQTFLPLRGTNLKQLKNRHFDHFFFSIEYLLLFIIFVIIVIIIYRL